MEKLKTIAESLNYENWDNIKNEFMRLNDVKQFSKEEISILSKGGYKNYKPDQISYFYLENATKILFNNKEIPIGKIEILCKKSSKNFNLTKNLIIKIGEIETRPARIKAYFKCTDCKKDFRVECNFAKWIKYFHGPVCKHCKKQIVHLTDTYNENYKKTMRENYGVDYTFQSPEIQESCRKTMVERHGVEYSGQSRELLLKSWNNTIWKNKMSKLELTFAASIVKEIDKDARTCLNDKDRPKIQIDKTYKYPDVLIKNKYVIELFGDYWHGNPLLYKEEHILPSGMTIKEKWEKDKKRIEQIESKNYKVLVIWEKDWLESEKDCLNKIKDFINGNNNKLVSKSESNSIIT